MEDVVLRSTDDVLEGAAIAPLRQLDESNDLVVVHGVCQLRLGTAPICCMISNIASSTQCSAILPPARR